MELTEMKRLFFVAMMLAASLTAQAADVPATTELTVAQALDVTTGLRQLSKYESADKVDKEGKPVPMFYKFSADLRMVIALNIDMGSRLDTVFQNARNDIVMANVDSDTGKVPDIKANAVNVAVAKLLNEPSRVNFYRIKKDDLKMDENPIPAPLLALIVPILDR